MVFFFGRSFYFDTEASYFCANRHIDVYLCPGQITNEKLTTEHNDACNKAHETSLLKKLKRVPKNSIAFHGIVNRLEMTKKGRMGMKPHTNKVLENFEVVEIYELKNELL